MKTNSIVVCKKVAIAGTLAILGVTASAHVFDDAKILHIGLKDLPGQLTKNTWYKAAPDYRHLSTWNSDGDTHKVKLESDQSIVNLESITSDVSTPTLARTLRNEPCFRVNQSRIITTNEDGVTTSTNLPHGAIDFAGATCSKTKAAWTVLIRFRPDMRGYVRPNDTEWWRLFGVGWESGKHGMLFGFSHIAGMDDQMQLHFLHGASGVSPVGYSSMVVHDQVWNEIAVIVDGNTLRVGLCNEKINMFTDGNGRIGPGQWVWNTKTYTFPEGTDFCPRENYTGVLSLGRNASPSAQLTAPRGDYHLVAFWDRPLSDHEVYEAFGAGHTPLVAVGGEANGFAADAFQGDTTKDVTIADNRPTSWQQIPSKLVQGKKLTIPFTAQGWHMMIDPTHKNMPQVLRIPCDAATTAVGAQLKVTLDSTEIGTATMEADKVNNELMIPEDLFATGDHSLVLERTDPGVGDLVIDGVFAEGSWRIGDANRFTGNNQFHQLVYTTSADYQGKPRFVASNNPTETLPREFDVLSGCWRDCSEFARNAWNNNPNKDPGTQQGPSRVTFDVPDDLYDAHYRYRFKFKLYGVANAGKDKNGNYRCKYVVNGVTNVYGAANMTASEFSFDISDRIVRRRNVVELVDDELGKTVDGSGNWTWDNWFVQICYWAMDIVPPKKGLMIIVK